MKRSSIPNRDTGSSSLSEAMGARISIAGPEKSMYLIIGNGVSPEPPVMKSGGEVVMKISPLACLAVLSFTNYMKLKNHRDIHKIGPVSIDIERYNRTMELLTQNG